MRVNAYIDGFNLYHAIDDTSNHHWKWLDLNTLCRIFAPDSTFSINKIYYFSAFATWKPDEYRRHRAYVKALESTGVVPVMGNFKNKDRKCFKCGRKWVDHEEKETDVNIALQMLMDSYKNNYDRALLITGDSDLVPPI